METTGQELTRRTYEDADLMRAFLDKNNKASGDRGVWPHILAFAKSLKGTRIIDIGCGPGIDARQFAKLGLQVMGIDYSEAMVQAAMAQIRYGDSPSYLRLDMREIGESFAPDSFDGAWVSASLIHVPETDVPRVLCGIHRVLVPGAPALIALKGGPQGQQIVFDDKYGVGIQREFIFWEEDNFAKLLREAGFAITNVQIERGADTGGKPTTWLRFTAQAVKR